jgi:hypothetical protein
VRAPQRRKQLRQQVGRDGGDRAEAQRPGQRARRRPGRLREVRGRGQQLLRTRDDVLPDRGEPHVAVVALDELHAQQRLQLLDPGRQRGLGDELGFGGDAEVQALGELDQVGELAQRGESRALHREIRSL